MKDRIGKKYNRLTVVERVANAKNMLRYLCKCECGKEVVVWACRLGKQVSRKQINVTIDRKTHCVGEWAKIKNIKVNTIWSRIRKGMKPKDAILTPVHKGATL